MKYMSVLKSSPSILSPLILATTLAQIHMPIQLDPEQTGVWTTWVHSHPGFFSIVYTILHNPLLVDSTMNMEEPPIWRASYKFYADPTAVGCTLTSWVVYMHALTHTENYPFSLWWPPPSISISTIKILL